VTVLGARRLDPERMDGEWTDLSALRRTLGRVAQVNARLGGTRALRKALLSGCRGASALQVLDVGTGDASMCVKMVEWGAAARTPASVVGVDSHPQITEIAGTRARSHEAVRIVRADGRDLPFPDRAFDVTTCTLTLHHLDERGAAALLSEMARVSRRMVLVNDLERCLPNLLGAKLLAATVWRQDPVVRHDGPLSVLRSFAPKELEAIGRSAGLRAVRVTRYFPYRLILSGEPPR